MHMHYNLIYSNITHKQTNTTPVLGHHSRIPGQNLVSMHYQKPIHSNIYHLSLVIHKLGVLILL